MTSRTEECETMIVGLALGALLLCAALGAILLHLWRHYA